MSPSPKQTTLRKRLIGFLSPPMLVILVISVWSDYREGMRVANEAYDHALASNAVAIAARLDRDGDDDLGSAQPTVVPGAILPTEVVDKLYYAVIDGTGRLVAGDRALGALAAVPAAGNPNYRYGRLGNQQVRVATYRFEVPSHDIGRATIVVAETTLKRRHAATRIIINALINNFMQISTVLAIIFFGVGRALSPLDALGRRISQRASQDLSPIGDTGVPGEARPLVRALDRLMGNLREAHAAQQTFISNAAHQLRTPLADLQTQLELATKSSSGTTRERFEHLHAAVMRLSHLTNQMLALARSGPDAAAGQDKSMVDLPGLLEEAASRFLDTALERRIDLGFEPEPACVRGSGWMLRELLANLIDNALRYVPEGGSVTVRCGRRTPDTVFLEVEDDGPGIPSEMHEKVFERFSRIAGNTVAGSGLGLSIVREAAARHEGSVSLHPASGGRGLRVLVSFPAPSQGECPAPEESAPDQLKLLSL